MKEHSFAPALFIFRSASIPERDDSLYAGKKSPQLLGFSYTATSFRHAMSTVFRSAFVILSLIFKRIWHALPSCTLLLVVLPSIVFCHLNTTIPSPSAGASPIQDVKLSVPDEIRTEALRPNNSLVGYPLPLATHLNVGALTALGSKDLRFSPVYQMDMIADGHYILPWFAMPNINPVNGPLTTLSPGWINYYQGPLQQAAALNLPISLVGLQWEAPLTDFQSYFDLPAADNPNVLRSDGSISPALSPFGGVTPWRELGTTWTSTPMMKLLQQWYPNPPKLLFFSDNEHALLRWPDVEQDSRYLSLYGTGRDENFKRQVVSQGWLDRYHALQQGMRDGLISPSWKNVSFVGYHAFGPPHFGRWPWWNTYSLYVPGRIDPNPLIWDGGSVMYYTPNFSKSTDFTVWSPQIEAMNLIFMQAEALRLNPDFWLEMATWDGHSTIETPGDKRLYYASLGQTYGPNRYGGMVQFGMWLLRPRVVREHRWWRETAAAAEPYFLPIVDAVDLVHNNSTLRAFWRKGTLVANRAHQHPYQEKIPTEYQNVDRWFLLDTNLDPPRPWTLYTQLSVYSLALVRGTAPDRQWLVYAYAPLGDQRNVQITIPGFGPITVDVSVRGSFYQVYESSRWFKRIPLAMSLTINPFMVIGGCYSSTGTIILGAPAPAGGAVVNLTTTNPATRVPPSITIPAGMTSARFPITTSAVRAIQTGDISASYAGESKTAHIDVRPAGVNYVTANLDSVVGSKTVIGTVKLECPLTYNLVVSLYGSKPSVANPIASSFTIPAGTVSKNFMINTAKVVVANTVKIYASGNGRTNSVTLIVTP